MEKLTTNIQNAKRKREELQVDLKNAQIGREDTSERKTKIAKLQSLKKENEELRKKLSDLSENDPSLIEAMRMDAQVAKTAANRWTGFVACFFFLFDFRSWIILIWHSTNHPQKTVDNIFTLKSFICQNFGMSEDDFSNAFDVPSNFDYLT